MPKPTTHSVIGPNTASDMSRMKTATRDQRTLTRAQAAKGNPHAADYNPFPGVPEVDGLVQDYYDQTQDEAAAIIRSKPKK